jgi:release factor glutamine methyltransferase
VPDDVGIIAARLRAAGCVFAEDEARLMLESASSPTELDRMVAERVAGTPLEQIVGWAEFRGLRIVVEPGVFVPRRRSALLVENAIALARPGAVVIDMCCGTGALGAALLAEAPIGELHAVELDPVGVSCARRNLTTASVHAGDLFDPLPARLRGGVDLILANAPYVPSAEIAMMPAEARDHEHRLALDGGVDGLDVQRRVIAEAPRWLRPGGHLLVETSERQAPATAGCMAGSGLVTRIVMDDDLAATVVIGTRR